VVTAGGGESQVSAEAAPAGRGGAEYAAQETTREEGSYVNLMNKCWTGYSMYTPRPRGPQCPFINDKSKKITSSVFTPKFDVINIIV